MTIWGTIYSYFFGSEIQHIYKEADAIYQESQRLQDSWVYLAEAPDEGPLDQASQEITASELQLLRDVLGEGGDKKVSSPLYDSFIHHVNQEIGVLTKTIDMMSQKFDELPFLDSIRENMHLVIVKLKAKQRELIEFKGRIILLASVNSEVKSYLQHKIVKVELEEGEKPVGLAPTPPKMPPYQVTRPVNIVKRKANHENVPASDAHATMIELLQKGVKLRKLADAEKNRELMNKNRTEMGAILFQEFDLQSVQDLERVPVKIDLKRKLFLELEEKKLTAGNLRKVSVSAPVRKSSKPDTLQSQMENALSARRAYLQDVDLSESEDNSEWSSQLFRSIHVGDETSSEDLSESSLSFHSSDMEERERVNHYNTPIMSSNRHDKENDRMPMMFKMSEDESSSDALSRGFIGVPVRACSQEEDLRAGSVFTLSRQVPQSV